MTILCIITQYGLKFTLLWILLSINVFNVLYLSLLSIDAVKEVNYLLNPILGFYLLILAQ